MNPRLVGTTVRSTHELQPFSSITFLNRSPESPPVPFSNNPTFAPGTRPISAAERMQAVDRQIDDAITEHNNEEFHDNK